MLLRLSREERTRAAVTVGSAVIVLTSAVAGLGRQPDLLTAYARDAARRELEVAARAEERAVQRSGAYRLSGSVAGVGIVGRQRPNVKARTVRLVEGSDGLEVGTRANGAWLCVMVTSTSFAEARCSPAMTGPAR